MEVKIIPNAEEKFYSPKPRPKMKEYITLMDGTTLKPEFSETDRRVGVEHVYFPVGDAGKGGKCLICRGRPMLGKVYENVQGEKTVLYECKKCGHLEAREAEK